MRIEKKIQTSIGFSLVALTLRRKIGVREAHFILHGRRFSAGRVGRQGKTIYLITFLRGRESHILSLDDENGSMILDNFSIKPLSPQASMLIDEENKSGGGDRFPWMLFLFDQLPLSSCKITLTYSRRKRDSDDVQVHIDGAIQRIASQSIKYKLWYFVGALLPAYRSRTVTESFKLHPNGNSAHRIELFADQFPIFRRAEFIFSSPPKAQEPTVEDPAWTGDFREDTDDILLSRLLFGEARGEPREAKLWIAGVVFNRVRAEAWANTVKDVILAEGQFDSIKPTDANFQMVIDPFADENELDEKAWRECYEIASGMLSGKFQNPTDATHFHAIGISREEFMRKVVPKGRFIRQIGSTLFYWSPN